MAPEGSAAALVAEMRTELADDLNAPGALAAVDRWAAEARKQAVAGSPMDQALVSDAVNSLLGVEL